MAEIGLYQPVDIDGNPRGEPRAFGGYDYAQRALDWGPPEYAANPGLVALEMVAKGYDARAVSIANAACGAWLQERNPRELKLRSIG